MNLVEWANRWGIPYEAINELREGFGMLHLKPPEGLTTEAAVSKHVRLIARRQGIFLWRNNVGAGQDENGNFFRYGLANDSKQMNEKIKSSDLIGIGPDGRFIARECKKPGWQYSGTPREVAQAAFIQLINANGGDAKFTTGEL